MSDLAQPKKPRHRHSALQLAGLNALYEQTEHPTLSQRAELAESLGLETKSVNAYFQNKRASLKKQPRGTPVHEPVRRTSHSHPHSHSPYPLPVLDDDANEPHQNIVHSRSQAPHDHLRRIIDAPSDREREWEIPSHWPLSPANVDELQQIRRRNPYPTADESRMIADRLQVHQSVIIDWFRTQQHSRSTNSTDYRPSLPPLADAMLQPPRTRLPPIPALPPATSHPSLLSSNGGSNKSMDSIRRLSAMEDQYNSPSERQARPRSRSSSPRNHHPAPYSAAAAVPPSASTSTSTATTVTAASLGQRPRRGRPDSFQLEGLRRLLDKTPNPTIEERSALGREIGMDLVKVSNWFRNLRQSKAKRERRRLAAGAEAMSDGEQEHDEAEEYDAGSVRSASTSSVYLSSSTSPAPSRSETPPPLFTTPSVPALPTIPALPPPPVPSGRSQAAAERSRAWMRQIVHSSDDEEDAQEAVTPPATSPALVQMHGHKHDIAIPPPPQPTSLPMDIDKPAPAPAPAYEDAMLLLSFHQQA